MNPKLRKVLAITGLVFMGLFLASMFMFFILPKFLGGMLWLVAAISFGVAVVMFCGIYFVRSFPSQQAKEEEMTRLREAYEKKVAEEAAAKEGGEQSGE